MSRVEQVLSCAGITFTGTNTPSYEENTVIKAAVAASHKTHLLGHNAREKLEVDMWLTFSANVMNKDLLSALNSTLLYKTFLVGCSFSLADIAVHVAVASTSRNGFANICRWDNHIRNFLFQPCGEVQMASSSSATFVPVAVMDSVYAASKAAPTAAPSSAPAAATAAPADKKQKTDKKASAAPKEAVKEEPAAAGENALDPTKLDIRCGLVVKCWNHPDSDKLLCEEIDVGGGEIRTIASGLRAFYTAEQVQGRKVVVLANLKERSMAGFKSQGMVLCAVSKDHSVVRLLEAPESANPGDKVTFPGFAQDSVAATPAQMAKKKILEGLAPQLRTDANGVAHWNESPFTMGSAGGVCGAPGVPDAVVS